MTRGVLEADIFKSAFEGRPADGEPAWLRSLREAASWRWGLRSRGMTGMSTRALMAMEWMRQRKVMPLTAPNWREIRS